MTEDREPLHAFDRARTELARDRAREFRTPLTLLLGPLQDLLDSPASALAPASRSALEAARRHALRLLTLLDALPDLFRREGEGGGAAREPADLGLFTAELAGNFRLPCEQAGLRLIVDCPPVPEAASVDRDAWEKIVVNLGANAFKSTIEGAIEVRLRAEDGKALLVVSDTGPGVTQAELRYVFEDLDRASRPAADRSRFGLAFVRELVLLHNGSIDARSTPGRGTSFTVLLPFSGRAVVGGPLAPSRPAGAPRDVQATPPEPAASRRGHVVIAEDHAETRIFLRHVLEAAGFIVEALADGTAALATCQARAPDVLVSDVLMPGLDGFELIERLRADQRTAVIPVLLLSARGSEDSRIEGIARGADDYLVKPLSSRELIARVDGAVRLARLRRETARREQQQIRTLSGRLVEVQEAERRELSAELHDRTSPQLAAIQINLNMLDRLLRASETEDVRALLDDTAGLLADTTLSIREISSNLRPTALDDAGLLPALAGYAHQFMQRTGIAVQVQTQDATGAIPPALQSSLFRIVQEALTNCAKHARAKNVTIRLSTKQSGHVLLTIADDGVGFDVALHTASGLGLLTMRERAEFLGGRFSLDSTPGQGTRIEVLI